MFAASSPSNSALDDQSASITQCAATEKPAPGRLLASTGGSLHKVENVEELSSQVYVRDVELQ